MIAVVTIAEKNERAKEKVVNKAVLGYDPEKWVESSLKVRGGNQDNRTSQYLDLPPPIQGKHKHSRCQQLYLDVHRFLQKRRWAPTDPDEDIAGVTWAEMFIMFDISGERSHTGEHVVDTKAKERAEARRVNSSKAKQQKQEETMRGCGSQTCLRSGDQKIESDC